MPRHAYTAREAHAYWLHHPHGATRAEPARECDLCRHAACILAERGDGLHHGCECHQTGNVAIGYACTCPTAESVAADTRRLAEIFRHAFDDGVGALWTVPDVLEAVARTVEQEADRA